MHIAGVDAKTKLMREQQDPSCKSFTNSTKPTWSKY